MNKRIKTIDYLKTIAIISVLLFHVGFLNNGYLGVEIFFVISGYLFIKGIKTKLEEDSFNPIQFILKKLSEFWPLIAFAGGICLIIGYFNMLPDDYENLAESVIASNFFSNNILQVITTKDYWNIGNTYKPLMHTWYIGVLLQSFIFLSIILWGSRKVLKKDYSYNILTLLSVISLLVFLLPFFSTADKFYLFPFRLFEITLGGILVYLPESNVKKKTLQLLGNIGIVILLFLLFTSINITNTMSILIIVSATALVIYAHSNINEDYGISDKIYNILSFPGKYSYDIYIWHQVVIAFLFYFLFQNLNILLILIVIIISFGMTILFRFLKNKFLILKNMKFRIIFSILLVIITSAVSMYIYLRAGVVRNIPELGVDVKNVHRSMHAEYVDVPYSWDVDFKDESKVHILVIGNSFGRDFANILNESNISDQLEISYIYGENASGKLNRIEEADFVFYSVKSWEISDWIIQNIDFEKLYIVGNKTYGNSNGIIYFNRNKEWYYDQMVELSDDFILNNNAMKGIYGDHYIDMISPLMNGNKISVFTDDHYYISQDCIHLTKYGAQYYSRLLDLTFIVDE